MDFGGHDLATAITPQDLIPGSVAQIDKTIEALVSVGVPASEVGDMLPTLDSDAWTGPAADAFHVAYSPQPPVWTSIGTGLTGLSDALKAWRDAVQDGQGQAWLAKGEWVQAQKMTDAAQTSYNQLTQDHHNLALAAQLGIAQAPAPLPPFTDPGASLRRQAQQRLNAARASVAGAENIAIAAMAAAREALPTAPDAWHRFGDDFTDDTRTFTTQVADVGKGAYHAVAGFVDTARAINPLDSENTAHPGRYALTMLAMAQGIGHDLTHPVDTLRSMANNASQQLQHDPGQLIGSLLPNVTVGLATDGTGDLAAGAADAASAGTDEATGLASAATDARGTAISDSHPVDPIDTHPPPPQAVTTTPQRLPGVRAGATDTAAAASIEQAGAGLSNVERDLATSTCTRPPLGQIPRPSDCPNSNSAWPALIPGRAARPYRTPRMPMPRRPWLMSRRRPQSTRLVPACDTSSPTSRRSTYTARTQPALQAVMTTPISPATVGSLAVPCTTPSGNGFIRCALQTPWPPIYRTTSCWPSISTRPLPGRSTKHCDRAIPASSRKSTPKSVPSRRA